MACVGGSFQWSGCAGAPIDSRPYRKASDDQGPADAGAVLAIEALILGVVVITVILLAVALQAPPPPSSTQGVQEMETALWDSLRVLDGMYYDDASAGNSVLSKAIMEALAGNEAPLVHSIESFVPPGAVFNVYLNNGQDRMTVFENRTPTGQTVGVSYPFEPRWDLAFTEPEFEIYDPAGSTTLGQYQIPIFRGNLVHDQGYPMRVEVSGSQSWVPGLANKDQDQVTVKFTEVAYSSVVQGDGSSPYSAASIYLECADGPLTTPCYGLDLSSDPLDGYEPVSPNRMTVVVANAGAGSLDAGTPLTVGLPVGLRVTGAASGTSGVDALFTDVTTQESAVGPTTVFAILDSPLGTNQVAKLDIDVAVDDHRYSFKTVDAQFGGDSVAASHFLVRASSQSANAYTGGDHRLVLVSGPKPAGDGSTTPAARWGVVMPMPFGEGTIKWINLTLPSDARIISTVNLPPGFAPKIGSNGGLGAGTIVHGPNWINFTSSSPGVTFPANSIVELQLMISFDGAQTPASHRFPAATPTGVFDGYNPRPAAVQLNPGIWYADEPPRTLSLPGYGRTLGLGEDTTRTFQSRLGYRNDLLVGTGDYRMVDLSLDGTTLAGVRDALKAASITPSGQTVAAGFELELNLDFRDLATLLSEDVGTNNLNITTRLYPPWGIPQRTALATWYHDAASGVDTTANDLEVAWLDGDTAQDVVVASQDGNVYALSGATGRVIAGKTFSLPESGVSGNPAGALLLSRTQTPDGETYAAGTSTGALNTYALDGGLARRFAMGKAESDVATLGINTTADFDLDGYPEIVVASDASQNGWANAAGLTRLTVFDGANGEVLSGWETALDIQAPQYGRVVNGSASQIGMGKLGADARDGFWVNTGLTAGLGLTYDAEATLADVLDDTTPENIQQNILEGMTVSWGVYDSGLVAFDESARYVWNFTGGRMVRTANANVPTVGGTTGFVGGGGDGWVYGLDARKAITPVTGFEFGNTGGFTDLEMANAYEGYASTSLGMLAHTRDGWTTLKPYTVPTVVDGVTKRKVLYYTGINAVDTLDADPWKSTTGDGAAVSWWVGDNGVILRSLDRLETMEEKTLTAQLQGTLSLTPDDVDVSFTPGLPDLSLANIDLVDVLAVTADEAWMVGYDDDGPGPATGYVVRTIDGGDTFLAYALECANDEGVPVADCDVHGIGSDGERLWIVGNSGLVLAQRTGGAADAVDLVSGGTLSDGRVQLSLSASQQVELDEITVTWSPDNVEWMKQVLVDGTTIWDITDGATVVTGTALAGVGAGEKAAIDLKAYDDLISGQPLNGDPDNNLLSGAMTLEVGPFKNSTDPSVGYYGQGTNDPFHQPMDLVITVSFTDGTQDAYVVGVGAGGATTREVSTSNWVDPAGLEDPFLSADDCFGLPDPTCTRYHAIEFQQDPTTGLTYGVLVGQPQEAGGGASEQHALTTLMGGSLWLGADLPIENVTLHDGAINAASAQRWVVVGENDRVIASYDFGITWTDLPKIYDVAQGPAAPLYAVEFDHNDVAYVAGGSSTGILWTVDGYTEWGRAETPDLYIGADPIERVFVDTRSMLVSQGSSGTAEVTVEIWDEDLAGGTWVTVHDPKTQWPAHDPDENEVEGVFHYDYTDETTDVRLRFTLHTPMHGFSRFSPQVRGALDLHLHEDRVDDWDDPAHTLVPFDINGTTFAVGDDTVHVTGDGALRLPAVHNPWVYKLVNPDTPDPGVPLTSVGARTGDLDVSDDGNTVYVGTEGLYNIGAAGTEAPVGYDNSLYAVHTVTGGPVAGWDVPRFDAPIRFVRAHDNGAFVITQDTPGVSVATLYNVTPTGRIYEMMPGTPMTYAFDLGSTVHDIALADLDGEGNLDPLVAVTGSGGTEGWVYGFRGDLFWNPLWKANPALRGTFDWTYSVPVHAMYGGYVLESTIRWTLDETLTGAGSSLIQTGRVFNAFTVTPPNGKVGVSYPYVVEVVAWLQDWG